MHILWISTCFDDSAVSRVFLNLLPYFPKSYTFTVVSIGTIEDSHALQDLKKLQVPHICLHCKKHQIQKMTRALNALITRTNPHVVHAQLGVSFIALLLSKHTRTVAKLASFHNNANYFNVFTTYALKLFFKRFHAISAVSCHALESIQQKFDTAQRIPSQVIYNPIPPYPSPSFDTQKKLHNPVTLLVAMRLDPQKGHELWVHMLYILKKTILAQGILHPDSAKILQFQLLCVGSGTLHTKLVQQCKVLGLDAQVQFPGYQHDVYTHIQEADIVLYPSQNEGFGLVPCEALIHGTPVIAQDLPVMHEILTDPIWLIDCNDSAAFAQKVLDIIKNYAHYATFARTVGHALQKKHAPIDIADEYRKFYEKYGAQDKESRR